MKEEVDQFQVFSQAARRIRKTLWVTVVLVGVVVAIVIPVFNFFAELGREEARAEQAISDLADRVSGFIALNPNTWDLMDERLDDIISGSSYRAESSLKSLTLFDGSTVIVVGSQPTFPNFSVTDTVTGGTKAVGKLSFDIGLSETLLQNALSSGFGVIISILCFVIFWFFPARLIDQALRLIDRSRLELQGQFQAISQAQREAEAANIAKSEFLATMSHELRTPLTSIKGSLGILKKIKENEVAGETSELIDIADRNSDALLVLINDLLDYEKIISGSMAIETIPNEICSLTRNVIDANQGYAETYSVRFVIAEVEEPAWARVDQHRFDQVLRNLLSNAAKFSEAGGRVEISVKREGSNIRVGIRDFGIGIPESHKLTIFERFSQIDSSDIRQKGGTGLGLAISKALVEGMLGEIGFVSEVGVGSTFYVDVPEIDPPSESVN